MALIRSSKSFVVQKLFKKYFPGLKLFENKLSVPVLKEPL